jgi:hypothetical protein
MGFSGIMRSERNHYLIHLRLDEQLSEAWGKQTVSYQNTNDFALGKLWFRIHDPGDKTYLFLKKISDSTGRELPFSLMPDFEGVIEVPLITPLKSQDTIELVMEYSVSVISRPYFIFKYLANYNFLQPRYWHPLALPSHQGKLQPMNKSFASYQIELEVPSGITVVSSGEEIFEKKIDTGYKKVISTASQVTNFGVMFFVDIQREDREVAGIKIQNYYSEKKAPWTKDYVQHAENILKFYLDELGFYPQKVISIVPGAVEKWGGGFPIASNIFAMHFSDGINEAYIKNITAHEIAHTYWGYDCVLVPREYGFWLGIALGIYTDSMFTPVSRRPYRWGYMLHQLLGYNTTLMQSNEEFIKYDIDLNNVLAHSKGPTVISLLEYVLGKEVFRTVFNTLLEEYKYAVLTAEDFQRVCEQVSGQDLHWFFKPWLYTSDTVDYIVSEVKTYKNEDRHITKVRVQKQGQIPMPVEVQVTTLDGKRHIQKLSSDQENGLLEFVTESGLVDVKLDPKEILPLISREKENINVSMAQYAFEKGKYIHCLEFCNQILISKPQNSEALYHRGRALKELGRFDLALKSFLQVIDLKDTYRSAQNLSPWSHIWRGYIFDLQGRRKEALEEYRKALVFPDYNGSREEATKRLESPYSEDTKMEKCPC